MIIADDAGRVKSKSFQQAAALFSAGVGGTEKPDEIAQMLGQQEPARNGPGVPGDELPNPDVEPSAPIQAFLAPPPHDAQKEHDVGRVNDVVRRVEHYLLAPPG